MGHGPAAHEGDEAFADHTGMQAEIAMPGQSGEHRIGNRADPGLQGGPVRDQRGDMSAIGRLGGGPTGAAGRVTGGTSESIRAVTGSSGFDLGAGPHHGTCRFTSMITWRACRAAART